MRKEDPSCEGFIKKLVTIVSSGYFVVGGVFHVVDEDNTGEFDPYFIERMKNAI